MSVRELAKTARARPLLGLVALALASLWLFGAQRFLRADGVMRFTLPRRAAPPAGQYNVASYEWGPTLRASSYYRDPSAHHHPMFLVDGRSMPSRIEKWASSVHDRAPWVEISWREPRSIEHVIVYNAGVHEKADLNRGDYTLRCLGGQGTRLEVKDTKLSRDRHLFACKGALGLRAEWKLPKRDDIVRIYEIEVWGQ